MAKKPAPKPVRRPAPFDLVRNPNFDAAMAQQNYANNLQQSLANFQTQNPAQGNFQKSIRDASKQIILSFEGETYGTANDKSANEIAKKYNLDIVQKPDRNSSIPVYIFSVKGEVDKSLSGIKNETGVKYAEPNYRMYSGFGGPDPIYQYEDNRMKAALAGEEIPARPAQSMPADRYFQTPNPPVPTSGSATPQVGSNITQMEPIPSQDEINKRIEYLRVLNENPRFQEFRNIPPAQIPNLPTTATSQIPPVPPVEFPSVLPIQQPQARRVQPTFRDAMAMQTYNNFMQQQLNALATNRINESMQMPAQKIPTSNKAAENYASLIPGQMNQQTNTTAPRIPTIPGMQQPSGFGSSQTENMPRQRQPRVGFGYLPKNEIAPVGY